MKERLKQFIREEEGASAVEYGLLVAGIAVVVMGAIYYLGGNLKEKFNEIADAISDGPSSSGGGGSSS